MNVTKKVADVQRTVAIGSYEAVPIKVSLIMDELKGRVAIRTSLDTRHLSRKKVEVDALMKQLSNQIREVYDDAVNWSNDWNEANKDTGKTPIDFGEGEGDED